MQKEKLSALMDGESIDKDVIASLSQDRLLEERWHRYHLIRDTLRGDIGEVIHLNIADNVAAALAKEPVISAQAVSQPHPATWSKMPFWHKIRPLFSQIGQMGVAAGVSLAVIVGVQQYHQQQAENAPEMPVFNTIPLGGQASPVSFDVANENAQNNNQHALEQHRRINTILQDYELQRRLHAGQLNPDSNIPSSPSELSQ